MRAVAMCAAFLAFLATGPTAVHGQAIPRSVERTALARIAMPGAPPLWIAEDRPTAQALAAVAVLEGIADRGLVPEDYGAAALHSMSDSLTRGPRDSLAATRFDARLSRAIVRLLADLHLGRVSPESLRFELPESHAGLDLAALAASVAGAADVAAAIAAAEPPYAGYRALVGVLAHYRTGVRAGAPRPLRPARGALRPGDRYDDLPALRALLIALGDLPESEAAARDTAAGSAYAEPLVGAVTSFQRRHGLDPDGVIGPATRAQLRVPMERRIHQIELTLERWRWLPDRAPDRLVVVNVPGFRLYAFEHDSLIERPSLAMNVIVGEARGRKGTPLFTGTMREVVFHPYWDVPRGIARREIVPLIRRDRGYAAREGFEIVRGGDEDATTFTISAATLGRVEQGTLRIRQRPGPSNALGAIKFVFPNSHNVYLHGTPALELFARSRRDFSHGCIRVEDPAALAAFVLRGAPGWERPAIDSALGREGMARVTLERPVAVYVLYATAIARADGTVRFYEDLYGHDAALERALARRRSGLARETQ